MSSKRLSAHYFMLGLCLSLGMMLAIPSHALAKTVLKIGHGTTEVTAMHLGWVKFKELVEERSKGEFEIQIYPNQQLGGDRELIEATQLGNIAGTAPSTAAVAPFDADFFIFDVPFLFKNRDHVYSVLDGAPGKAVLKSCEKYNLKGLGYFENGFRDLTNSKRPVNNPGDLSGLKLRTMENPLHLAAWQALGANPTPMAFGELFTALQQKTVDGQENPMELIANNKFYEVQPHLTKTQHIYSPYVIVVNLELWNDLKPAQQELLQKATDDAVAYQRNVVIKAAAAAEETIRKAGTKIVELTPEGLAAFQDKVKVVLPLVKSRVNPEVYSLFIENK